MIWLWSARHARHTAPPRAAAARTRRAGRTLCCPVSRVRPGHHCHTVADVVEERARLEPERDPDHPADFVATAPRGSRLTIAAREAQLARRRIVAELVARGPKAIGRLAEMRADIECLLTAREYAGLLASAAKTCDGEVGWAIRCHVLNVRDSLLALIAATAAQARSTSPGSIPPARPPTGDWQSWLVSTTPLARLGCGSGSNCSRSPRTRPGRPGC